jgi:hypothetical protein
MSRAHGERRRIHFAGASGGRGGAQRPKAERPTEGNSDEAVITSEIRDKDAIVKSIKDFLGKGR